MASQELQSFASMTVNVLHKDGISGYLPTIVVPSQRSVAVIEGIPVGVADQTALQEKVIEKGLLDLEFWFGVKSGDEEVTVGVYRPGDSTEFALIKRQGSSYQVISDVDRRWWTIDGSAPSP